MSTYHEKKYTTSLLVKMTGEQKKKLFAQAKKLGITASEAIRRMIMLVI